MTLKQQIREILINTLAEHYGNQTHAAGALGLSVRAMNYKMKAMGIPRRHDKFPTLEGVQSIETVQRKSTDND